MKKLVLFTFAVAAMASCSKNEVTLDGTQKTIGFNDAQWGNSVVSRATSDLGTTIALGVFAYQTEGTPSALYINDELSYQADAWKLSKTYYWPLTDPELTFYAYGPKTASNGISAAACTVGGTPTLSYTVTGNPGSQTDVIVDLAGKTQSTGKVTFALSHVLSQVQFKVQLSASANSALEVKINSITVKAPASADFAISSGVASWTNQAATNTDYASLASETEVTAANGSPAAIGAVMNMIPGSGAEIVVVATAYDKSTGAKVGEKTTTIKCDGTSPNSVAAWVAGTQVTYTLTLDPDSIASGSGAAIEFGQPTVNEWTGGSGSINM